MSLHLTFPTGPITPSVTSCAATPKRATPFECARRFWYSMRRFWWGAYWHLEVEGVELVPNRGPALLCANHASHLDAPAILAALPRKGKLPRPADVRVRFGEPIDPRPYRRLVAGGELSRREAYDRLTAELKTAIEVMAE